MLTDKAICRLDEVAPGTVCRVESIAVPSDQAARLAGLGIGVGRQVRILRPGDPTVVQVYGARMGLARSLAREITVRPDGVGAAEAEE